MAGSRGRGGFYGADASTFGNYAHKKELEQRLYALMNEFKERGPDDDGATYSLFTALHPDENPPAPDAG